MSLIAILQQLGSKIPGMNRPKGLNVSALAMSLCNVMLWVVFYNQARPHYLRVLAFCTVMIGIGFVFIWFYWQGKNWALISVLIYSALCVLNLRSWNSLSSNPYFRTTPTKVFLASRALLGVVLLFWLNTRPVREFFQGKSQLPLVAAKQRDSIFFDMVVVPLIPVILLAGIVLVAFRYTVLPRVTGPVVTLSNAIACHGNSSDTVGCITPPRQTHAPQPEYPSSEREAHHQGTVRLTLVVSSDGVPRDIAVSRTLTPDFDKAAIAAVKEWKFTPAIKDGKPIAVQIALEIEFHLFDQGRS